MTDDHQHQWEPEFYLPDRMVDEGWPTGRQVCECGEVKP